MSRLSGEGEKKRKEKKILFLYTKFVHQMLLQFSPGIAALCRGLIGPTQLSKQQMTPVYLCCFSILPKIYNAGF